MDETTQSKPGMPKWAKVLLTIGVVITIAIIGLVVAGGVFMSGFRKDAVDPAKIRALLNSMATVDDPLPPGFRYEMQIDLGVAGTKIVSMRHDPDGLHLILTSLPWTKSTASLEESINASTVSSGVSNNLPNSDNFKASTKGTETIAGKTFSYAIGTTKTKNGDEFPSLIGVFTPGDGKHVIMLTGAESNTVKKDVDVAKQYNMQATDEFLHAIKKI
jgi:hypothetical protein